MTLKLAKIRTSDRIAFKRCRRKWNFSSSMRSNLESNLARGPLWLGTGFHYAMEDFHGYNKYGSPTAAFHAYVKAYRTGNAKELPGDFEELTELGVAMLDYYQSWLSVRGGLQTYWHNGEPQVEVRFEIPLPVDPEIIKAYNNGRKPEDQIEGVVYQGTIDRVCIDEHNRLWLVDYKTAKAFEQLHFETDPQITAYCWAGSCIYELPIAGFIYQQHKKTAAQKPELLKSGTYSCAQGQPVTHRSYKDALVNLYGKLERAPDKNIQYLNSLAAQETPDADFLIRRDYVYRYPTQLESEGAKILMETHDMLDPNLSLYPNPTRECSWCDFINACILMDTQEDWQEDLLLNTVSRSANNEFETWRKYV